MTGFTRVVFHRPGGRYRDRSRTYVLEIDGAPRARIACGQEVGVDVEPGVHTAQARIGRRGSTPVVFTARPGRVVRFCVHTAGGPWRLIGRRNWLRITANR